VLEVSVLATSILTSGPAATHGPAVVSIDRGRSLQAPPPIYSLLCQPTDGACLRRRFPSPRYSVAVLTLESIWMEFTGPLVHPLTKLVLLALLVSPAEIVAA